MAALEIHNIWYYFSDPEKQLIPIWTTEALEKTLAMRSETTAFISEQEYYNNDIHKYCTLVLVWPTDERYAFIEKVYGLKAGHKYFFEGKWYYKFTLRTTLLKARYNDLSATLAILYDCTVQHYYPYKHTEQETLNQSDNFAGIIEWIREMIDDRQRNVVYDPKNQDKIEQANRLPIKEVVAKSKFPNTHIDEQLDVIVGYGSPFTFVKHAYKSINAAYRFFNTNFNIDFTSEEETTDYFMTKWVMPTEGILQKGTYMGYENKEGIFVRCTDFVIYVHYRIVRPDEISYIVSLEWEASVKHIEWKNFSGEGEMTKFLHGLGPFHYYGGKIGFPKIHEYISNAKVPEIHTVNKFWINDLFGKRYLVYADAIVDTETKQVIEPWKDSDIFFITSTKGVKMETAGWHLLREELGEKTPFLGKISPSIKYEDVEAIFTTIFKDNSADMLMFTLCTWMGNALYNDYIDCPLFFATGPSGSGKTTYSRILSTAFGIEKPLSLEGTTPFPLRMGLTFVNQLPFFMSEFRTRMASVYEKTQILKALFDGTPFERGRKDLSVEKSIFSASGFIEWEELPESGATRTRMIIHSLSRAGQNELIKPDYVLRENLDTIKWFQYAYITNTRKDEFNYHMWVADEIFSKVNTPSIRVLSSIKLMYACVSSYAPDRTEEWFKKLSIILEKQIEDYKKNATGMEVVKIAQRYLQSKWAKLYIQGYNVILPWQELWEYIQRSHTMTELGFESYKSNLEGMWFEFGYYEVTEDEEFVGSRTMLIEGMKIYAESIPNEFKCHPDIYSMTKEYMKHRVVTSK